MNLQLYQRLHNALHGYDHVTDHHERYAVALQQQFLRNCRGSHSREIYMMLGALIGVPGVSTEWWNKRMTDQDQKQACEQLFNMLEKKLAQEHAPMETSALCDLPEGSWEGAW